MSVPKVIQLQLSFRIILGFTVLLASLFCATPSWAEEIITVQGPVGGPFTASGPLSHLLRNRTEDNDLYYYVYPIRGAIGFSISRGILRPGAEVRIDAQIDPSANNLPAGTQERYSILYQLGPVGRPPRPTVFNFVTYDFQVHQQSGGACFTTNNLEYTSIAIPNQTGSFTFEADVEPSQAASGDAIFSLSATGGPEHNDQAVQIRAINGIFDARNGGAYEATNSVSYTIGAGAYHFRVLVDVPQRRYTAYVRPPGQNEILLADNFSFRSTQLSVTSLAFVGGWHNVGPLSVCDIRIDNGVINFPPIADAGPNQSIPDVDNNGNEAVTLNGSGSYDLDGRIVLYEWREGAVLLSSGIAPTSQVNLSLGQHLIELTVTDNEGNTDSDSTSVNVYTAGSGAGPIAFHPNCDPSIAVPDEFNTGAHLLPGYQTLSSFTVTQSMSNVYFTGQTTIGADGVTLDNVVFDGSASNYALVIPNGRNNTTITNATIKQAAKKGLNAQGPGHNTLLRRVKFEENHADHAYIHLNADPNTPYENFIIEESFFHRSIWPVGPPPTQSQHFDDIQVHKHFGATFRYNRMLTPVSSPWHYGGYLLNRSFMLQSGKPNSNITGDTGRIKVECNIVQGGGPDYSLQIAQTAPYTATDFTIRNNLFGSQYSHYTQANPWTPSQPAGLDPTMSLGGSNITVENNGCLPEIDPNTGASPINAGLLNLANPFVCHW